MPQLNYNKLKLQRIKHTEDTDGGWQQQLLTQGLSVLDYDFDTDEYIVYNIDAIETITAELARALSYNE